MLTIRHPQVALLVQDLPIGLCPLSIGAEIGPKLIIKTTKEMLLAAKVNGGFKMYVVPLNLAGQDTVGIISAFFDDQDEPLVIFTPLFEEDMAHDLINILSRSTLDVHCFDDNNREILGYTCRLECPAWTKERLATVSFPAFELDLARLAQNQLHTWFGNRSHDQDLSAISVVFVESLIPEDLLILDAQPDSHLLRGGPPFSFSQLEREEPGAFQEQDIAKLLQRLFSSAHLYMNPLRVTDGEEIADILVVTDTQIIVLQAKDSPNTEKVLRNAIERKKSTARKALFKALSQVKGALRYLRSMSPLKMSVHDETIELDISKHHLRALVVVKELFNDEYSVYSPPILEVSKETQVPCIALDYAELQMYTGLSSENKFLEAFDLVFSHGSKTGKFPRLRIWSVPEDDAE